MRAALAALDATLPPGATVFHFAPGALPQETFLLARHYRPAWRQCLVAWHGRAFSRETAGYIGDACVVPDLARAAAGQDRLFRVLPGWPSRPLLRPGDRSAAADPLAAETPPGFHVQRARDFHLVRVVEIAR